MTTTFFEICVMVALVQIMNDVREMKIINLRTNKRTSFIETVEGTIVWAVSVIALAAISKITGRRP